MKETDAVAACVATPPDAPKGLARQISYARETAREIAEQVERFSRRLDELRALAQVRDDDPRASQEILLRRVSLQDFELTLALEELRAQNAQLSEAYDLVEEQRARYADLFDHAPDAYVTTDARGVVHEANVAAASMLGLPQAQMPGKLLIAFVARRDTRSFRQLLKELQGTSAHAFSVRLRARGGAPFQASLSVRAIRRAPARSPELHWSIRAA